MKAYIQIIDSKVMLSKLPKPDIKNYEVHGLSHASVFFEEDYEKALNEFNNSIIGEAENAVKSIDDRVNGIIVKDPQVYSSTILGIADPNQPCEVEPSGDKWIITAL